MTRGENKKARPLRAVLLLIGSSVLGLALLEIGARLAGPFPFREPPLRSSDSWRDTVHQASDIPGLSYELVPNVNREVRGLTVRTNAVGMRDDGSVALEKAPGVRRIAVVGDSYTFGFGVQSREAYPAVLEARLNEETGPDGPRFEVLNFGVGGYSTRDEALVLEHRVLAFDPDLIVVGYVLNDPEIEPIHPLESHFEPVAWWQHSNVLRRIVKARHDSDVNRLGGGDYFKYLHAEPEKWAIVETALGDMADVAQAATVPLVVMIFPVAPTEEWETYRYREEHAKVAAAAAAEGLEVLDLLPTYEQFPGRQLRVSANDTHPNVNGHEIAAQAIRDYVRAKHPELLAAPR